MQTQKLLGTDIELRVVTETQAEAESIFDMVWNKVQDFNDRYSRFNPDSQLSQFNSKAGERVIVSQEFLRLLQTARKYGEITEGLFNPFTLPILQKSGYEQSLSITTIEAPNYMDRSLQSSSEIEIGEDWVRIPKDSALDLGGIGKGFCADELRNLVASQCLNFCFSFGGDIAVSGKDSSGPWEIDVESFNNPSEVIATYSLVKESEGIATSGLYRRNSDKKIHHIINPVSGEAVVDGDLLSCTIVAKNTTAADVLASCVLIGGRELAEYYVMEDLIEAALIQTKNQSPFVVGKEKLFTGVT